LASDQTKGQKPSYTGFFILFFFRNTLRITTWPRDARMVRASTTRIAKETIRRVRPHVIRELGRAGGMKATRDGDMVRAEGGAKRIGKVTRDGKVSVLTPATNHSGPPDQCVLSAGGRQGADPHR
jgi:hypothetical protein